MANNTETNYFLKKKVEMEKTMMGLLFSDSIEDVIKGFKKLKNFLPQRRMEILMMFLHKFESSKFFDLTISNDYYLLQVKPERFVPMVFYIKKDGSDLWFVAEETDDIKLIYKYNRAIKKFCGLVLYQLQRFKR